MNDDDFMFASVDSVDDVVVLVGIACDETRGELATLAGYASTPFPVITGIPCDGWDGAMQLQVVRYA